MSVLNLVPMPSFRGPEGQEDMPFLLTTGAVTTSPKVKLAMMADYGANDVELQHLLTIIRQRVVAIAQCPAHYECLLLPGDSAFTTEAVFSSFCPKADSKTLVIANGVMGDQAALILEKMGRPYVKIDKGDSLSPTALDVSVMLNADPKISHVWVAHCEVTSGLVNPLAEIAEVVNARNCQLMVDATLSFGAIPLDVAGLNIAVVIASSDNALEAAPGLGLVLARRAILQAAEGYSPSRVLDLHARWVAGDKSDGFTFPVPPHLVVALYQALMLFDKEGGVAARQARYMTNSKALVRAMRNTGFRTLINDGQSGPIVQVFLSPADAAFHFSRFQERLRRRGFLIGHGLLSKRESFRIATMGEVNERNIQSAVAAISEIITEMGIRSLSPI